MIITNDTIDNNETRREVIKEIKALITTIKYSDTDVYDLKFKLVKINRVEKDESYY